MVAWWWVVESPPTVLLLVGGSGLGPLDRIVAIGDGGIVIGGAWILVGGGRVKNVVVGTTAIISYSKKNIKKLT